MNGSQTLLLFLIWFVYTSLFDHFPGVSVIGCVIWTDSQFAYTDYID